MNGVSGRRRFRMSIRTLMIAVALWRLLLTPLVWMLRRTQAAADGGEEGCRIGQGLG